MANQTDIKNLQNKMGSETEDLKSQAKEGYKAVKEKGSELFEEAGQQVKQYANDANDAVTSYVKKNPFTAIGLSVLAGITLTLLLSK